MPQQQKTDPKAPAKEAAAEEVPNSKTETASGKSDEKDAILAASVPIDSTPDKNVAATQPKSDARIPDEQGKDESFTSNTHPDLSDDNGHGGHDVALVAPTTLRRGNNVATVSSPGAHHVAGTGRQSSFAEGSAAAASEDMGDDDVVVVAEAEVCISAHMDCEAGGESTNNAPENTENELFEGQIVPDRKSQPRNNKKGWMVIAVTALLGIIVIILVVSLTTSGDEDQGAADGTDPNDNTPLLGGNLTVTSSPTISPSASPTPRFPPFSDDLPGLVANSIRSDLDSPFYQANAWLVNHPDFDQFSLPRKKQLFYMVLLFFATNGENWTNNKHWLGYDVSECDWYSSSSYATDSLYYEPRICDDEGTLINLSLHDNNLNGPLPIWYTSFLPTLKVFDLSNNSLGEDMPVFTTSEYLEVLSLSNTEFRGSPIVNVLGTFANLRAFEWANAKVTGENNGGLYFIMPNLEKYNVNGMNFQGPIYTAIGSLSNLEFLGYNNNGAKGTIPSELGLLTELAHADLSRLPNLSGTIPSELGQLTKLTMLDLTGTPITGSLPGNLCSRVVTGDLDARVNCTTFECCQ